MQRAAREVDACPVVAHSQAQDKEPSKVVGAPWDCLSCGAHAQTKAFCDNCGAAQPVEGEDFALSLMMGVVCERCDAYNDPGVAVCASCGNALAALDAPLVTPPEGTSASPDELATQPTVERPVVTAAMPAAAAQLTSQLKAAMPPPAPGDTIKDVPVVPDEQTPAPSTAAPPPSWLTPPSGSPLHSQFAMPKVDLAAVATAAKAAEGAGIAAPKVTGTPAPASQQTGMMQAAMPAPTGPATAPLSAPLASPAHTPPPAAPSGAAAGAKAAPLSCWRCGTSLSSDDKFCRNCGARAGEAPAASPLATTQIAAVKMPGPLPSPVLSGGSAGATMVMPAMRVAQQSSSAAADAPAGSGAAGATLFFGAAQVERVAKLILVRGQSSFGTQWRLQAEETIVGRSIGQVLFPDDAAMAHQHCRLVFRGSDLWLDPEPSINGVFIRLREPARLVAGDEMVVGAQRLRVLADADRPIAVVSDGTTRVLGSLIRPTPPIMLLRIAADPAQNEVFHRCQRLLTIGRNNCDLNFPRDSFVSERHAQISQEPSSSSSTALLLEDLRSRNGTYLRARSATKLAHGDLVLLGDKVLRVELPR